MISLFQEKRQFYKTHKGGGASVLANTVYVVYYVYICTIEHSHFNFFLHFLHTFCRHSTPLLCARLGWWYLLTYINRQCLRAT